MIVFVSAILTLLSIGFLALHNYGLGLFISLLVYLFFLFKIKNTYGYNSLIFLFLVFFGLYGYSIPISIFFELDIGWYKIDKFFYWDKIDSTLFSFLISNQIALLALILSNEIIARYNFYVKDNAENDKLNIFHLSIVAGGIASLFEIIHFFRVGGMRAIVKGKAFYQSAVNDLILNVPVDGFFYIAFGLFFLYQAKQNKFDLRKLFVFILSISFYLFVNLSIGERGTMIVAMAVSFLAYTFYFKITKVRWYIPVLLLISFVLFNIVTVLREPDNTFGSVKQFIENHGKKMVYLFNPSNTEFGAAAYNYRLYTSEPFEWKKGSTYLEIIVSPLPTYIYPNKPQSILYEYRDKFNAERKEQGSIAGTGFSSLLESYINFSYFGHSLYIFFIRMLLLF
ncbi:MAG: O-antigen polysaccharide polymerase Wzy [Chitinophagales bacterium]